MFNFQVFFLLIICDDVKETRSVDCETFCYTISKSLTSILPCQEIDYPLAPRPPNPQHLCPSHPVLLILYLISTHSLIICLIVTAQQQSQPQQQNNHNCSWVVYINYFSCSFCLWKSLTPIFWDTLYFF